MHRALPGEHEQPGLLGAPALERRRPLGHPREVTDLLAALDRRAVDVARDDRLRLARDHPHHRLVQQRQPLGHPARVQGDPAPAGECHRRQVGFAVPAGDRHRALGAVGGGGEVAGHDRAEHLQERDPAVLDRVVVQLVCEALRPGAPAGRERGLAVRAGRHREPEGSQHREAGLAAVPTRDEGPLEGGDEGVVLPEELGRGGEVDELVDGQRVEAGRRPRVVRSAPVTAPEGGARLLQPDHVHSGSSTRERTAIRRRRAPSRTAWCGPRSCRRRSPRRDRRRRRPWS